MKRLALVACLIAVGATSEGRATVAASVPCGLPVAYPGDSAPQQSIAVWMAHGARARGIPGELPVMGALVESGLKNLNFGDADAKGFFAMREGIWNNGPYAGFPDHPELQLTWFIDQALKARAQRIALGDAAFGLDPSQWGEWIADVERPAEQFRGRYQLRLAEAQQLVLPDCSGFLLPVALDDAYRIGPASPLIVATPGVLANDSAVGAPSAALVTGPGNGTLTLAPDGSFEYRSNDGFSGTDSFTYRIHDGYLTSGPATVTIDVVAAPPSNDFALGRVVRLRDGSAIVTVRLPGPGTVTIRQADASAPRASARRTLVRTARKVVGKAGPVKVALRPTTAGKKLLRRKGKLAVRVKVTFRPTGGTAKSTFKKVTLRRARHR